MASTEELFISISPQIYRQNKSSGLMSQVELLHSLKHLQNLKVLSRQKNDLKGKFHKLLSSIIRQVDALQAKMPTPQLPETVQKHEKPRSESVPKVKKISPKRDAIEEELIQIQAKLQALNN
jgi:hypothetical protein